MLALKAQGQQAEARQPVPLHLGISDVSFAFRSLPWPITSLLAGQEQPTTRVNEGCSHPGSKIGTANCSCHRSLGTTTLSRRCCKLDFPNRDVLVDEAALQQDEAVRYTINKHHVATVPDELTLPTLQRDATDLDFWYENFERVDDDDDDTQGNVVPGTPPSPASPGIGLTSFATLTPT